MFAINLFDALDAQAEVDATAGISIAELLHGGGLGHYATRLPPGSKVNAHYHMQGQELYLILEGSGLMHLWEPGGHNRVFHRVERGSIFSIPPGIVHQLENDSSDTLVLLFSCHPSHLDDDRVVV